jgi:hypothetical protein
MEILVPRWLDLSCQVLSKYVQMLEYGEFGLCTGDFFL